MRFLIVAAVLALFVSSCDNTKEKLLTTEKLPLKEFTINIDRDTTLQTKKGALLKIPAGALKAGKRRSVTLEVREAYSLADMIRAGLSTQSDGKPLSSGGMIYIGIAKGQSVSFAQPIKVAIPADYLQNGMQLYKGEENNGKVNWTNPGPLPENKQLTSIDTGKILFESRCASCHGMGRDLTGPDLAHFVRRFPYGEGSYIFYDHAHAPYYPSRDIDTILAKSHSPNYEQFGDFTFYRGYEAYKCNLVNMYHAVSPVLHSDSNQAELGPIFNFIQNESDRLNLPLPSHAFLKDCIDSCELYKNEMTRLQYEKNKGRQNSQALINENGPLVKVGPDTTWPISQLPVNFDEKVSPRRYDAVYYQFSVESFGWLNVDMMLDQVQGVEKSELFVKVSGNYKEKVKSFLIIPSVKTYAEGGPAESNAEEFAYYLKNGEIPLPQNVDAYILAVTETDSTIAYGLKKFTTSKKQEIEISLHLATKEEFTQAMSQFETQRLHIKVSDTKNAKEIRKEDTNLKKIDEQLQETEKLKPKNCDCDCGGIVSK